MSTHRLFRRPPSQPVPDMSGLETDAANVLEMILIAQADARSLSDTAPPSRELLNRHLAVLCLAQDQMASLQAQLAQEAAELVQRAPIGGKEAVQ